MILFCLCYKFFFLKGYFSSWWKIDCMFVRVEGREVTSFFRGIMIGCYGGSGEGGERINWRRVLKEK